MRQAVLAASAAWTIIAAAEASAQEQSPSPPSGQRGVADTPGATVPVTDILGASIGARFGEDIRFSLFCRNCTNVHAPTYVGTDPGDASARDAFGQPAPKLTLLRTYSLDAFRTLGLALTAKF